MALPEPANTKTSLLCKLKYVANVLVQEVAALKNLITYPLAIARGGTAGITAAAARVNLALPTVTIAALDIDWAASDNFQKTMTGDDNFTMSNLADGLSIQIKLLASGGARTPNFPGIVNFPEALDPIPSGETNLYSFTRIGGVVLGVITPYGVI